MEVDFMLPAVLTALSFAIIYYHIKVFSFWNSRGVKGPIPWPLFGNNASYIFKNREQVDQEWRDKFGHTYGFYDGYSPILRTTNNELIRFIFIKNFSSFTDRDSKMVHGDNIKRWIFWSIGDHWSNQRALVTPMFTSSKMRTMFNSMTVCVIRFMEEVSSRLQTSKLANDDSKFDEATTERTNEKASIFSKDDLMAFTLDVIAQSFFSLKLDTYKDKTSDFFKRAFAFTTFNVPYLALWLFIPLPIKKYFKIDLIRYYQYEYFDKLSESTIIERRKDGSKKRNDFIQALLEAKVPNIYEKVYTEDDDIEAHYNDKIDHKELERINKSQVTKVIFKKFDDLEIRAQMTFFFIAGFETTSSTLSACLFELAHQQEVQTELYEELKSLKNVVDYSNLLSLKKLDAFISETLRLYSPLMEYNRVVTVKEGVVLPSTPPIKLPHGCTVSIPGYVLQRDHDYWQNPLKFDMTRFYPENRYKIKTCTYIPFGVGPRNCVGMRFALLEIKLCLAKILLKYSVRSSPKSQKYPPKFRHHTFFLQLINTDFRLIPRSQ